MATDIIHIHEVNFEFMGMWERGVPSLAATPSYPKYGSQRKLHKKGEKSENNITTSNIST